ncbi:MAG: T9SS type A sorting domain-containing protein [Sphingomonadales bacterium]|nr:T9SS type A sorting domain-containing protein [Sphingomonadales bacterium]
MKKLLLVFTAAILGSGALVAQQNVLSEGVQSQLKRADNQLPHTVKGKGLSRRDAGNGWYIAVDEARAAGESYLYYGDFHIWPDSLPILRYSTRNDHAYIHGVGATLDPKADYLTTRLSQFNNYTVDTFFFVYKYYNPVPSHTDSLIVQVYDDSGFSRLRWQSGENTYAPVLKGLRSPNAIREYKYLLDTGSNTKDFFVSSSASYTGQFVQVLNPPVSVRDMNAANRTGLFGFTAYMKPNYSYKMGDTMIYGRDTSRATDPVKKISAFQPYCVQAQTGLEGQAFYNYALINFSSQRYSSRATEWFLPYNIPSSQRIYLYSGFHVNYFNLGNKRFENSGADISNVYPNPAAKNSDLMVQVKLKQASDVSVDIFNAQGQKVKSIAKQHFAAGTSSISFNVAELPAGSYFVRMSGSFGAVSQAMLLK